MNPSVASVLSTLDPTKHRKPIRDELIAAICARLPAIVVVGAVPGTALIVSLLWEVVTPLQMLMWLAVHFAIVLMQWWVYLRHRALKDGARESVRLALRVSILLVGLYWAVLLAFLFTVTPGYSYHLYLCLFVAALAVIGVALASEDLPTWLVFAIPPTLTLSAMALSKGQPKYLGLAAIELLSVAALALLTRTKHRGQVEALAMRFAIIDLASELTEQRDAAERANIAKSKFLAAASHDLRQPMHALTLLTTALQESALPTGVRSIAEDIRGAVGSLEKMFDSLLDVSRLDAGVLQPNRVDFRLGDLLKRVTAEFAIEARTKGIELHCSDSNFIASSDPV
jgi:two-component system, sensor histidine kinase